MDAVSLTYLNIGQPSILERLGELPVGERPGDAARVCPHIGAGRVVHALVGDHIGDGEPPHQVVGRERPRAALSACHERG
jgi:hypothetical protein